MPRGLEVKGKNGIPRVLKLLRTLYGLRQIPRAFLKYMNAKMILCGMVQSNMDPCLFIGKKFMAIIYVEDILFWSVNESNIHDLAMQLREQGVDLEQEDDAAGFVGITLGCNEATCLMEMKQVGLINVFLETLGLDDGITKNKFTPSGSSPLVKDADGLSACGSFRCCSMVGMLIYLSGRTLPDISYLVNCCASYMFCPKHSHETSFNRI